MKIEKEIDYVVFALTVSQNVNCVKKEFEA